MIEERDRLNATLTEMSNEIIRLQSLLKKTREDCRNRGGDLVVINDDDEQNFLSAIINKETWIGLNDIETEGSWKWVDDTPLTQLLTKYWSKKQPDNGGGDPLWGEEDCAQSLTYKVWNDVKCSDSMQWIYEKDPV
ncbi:CD209 antigen-like protein A [Xiphophorus couchianus]|uniref:CD209 antigen-like protein A n=1 Tax=Xiphophorus couchianus TaxID=32473 RepID=UPI0010166E0F|nr:CD209 antigen-like protein A [Xiphophorus couchianus]